MDEKEFGIINKYMNKSVIIFALLFATALTALTACDADEDSTEVNPPAAGEDNDNEYGDNQNNGEENEMNNRITIRVGDSSFTATLEDNATARAFAALLPMTVEMDDLNQNEKYCYLSHDLPAESYQPGTIHRGDLMLYGSRCIVLFYETFSTSYSYTRIGRLDDPSETASVLGTGSVTVTFEATKEQKK